jgi:hypothetical protein
VKLRGRTTTPDKRHGRTMSFSARGAEPPAHHVPLQRWLGIVWPRLDLHKELSRSLVKVLEQRGAQPTLHVEVR